MKGRYIVKRPFRYGEKYYKPGDEFEPLGGRLDNQIIKGGYYVTIEPEHEDKTRAKGRGVTRRAKQEASYAS